VIYLDSSAVVKLVHLEAWTRELVSFLGGVDDVVRATAAAFEDGSMRTLDAIHLGTALVLMAESSQDLEAFVAYDRYLLSAAAAMDMPIHSPGQE